NDCTSWLSLVASEGEPSCRAKIPCEPGPPSRTLTVPAGEDHPVVEPLSKVPLTIPASLMQRLTLSVSPGLVPTFPPLSVALPVRTWLPGGTVEVSHW